MTQYYKILARGRKACHGGTYTYPENRWTKRIADTLECHRGYHIATLEQLVRWLFFEPDETDAIEIWECDADGVTSGDEKCVAERIKITRLLGTLDEIDLRWLASEFAITALHNTTDERVSSAIQASRTYCFEDVNLSAAWAARSAARSAAESAAASAAASAAKRYGDALIRFLSEAPVPDVIVKD